MLMVMQHRGWIHSQEQHPRFFSIYLSILLPLFCFPGIFIRKVTIKLIIAITCRRRWDPMEKTMIQYRSTEQNYVQFVSNPPHPWVRYNGPLWHWFKQTQYRRHEQDAHKSNISVVTAVTNAIFAFVKQWPVHVRASMRWLKQTLLRLSFTIYTMVPNGSRIRKSS